jgi:metallophosphoesterase (TIGR00282 family)
MIILMLGDVVGPGGCAALRGEMAALRARYQPDAIIVNGENSARQNGITPASAQSLFDLGADVITTGNHVFRRREIYDMLDAQTGVIRPANYSPRTPGSGVYILDRLSWRLAVINLAGAAFMDPAENPFDAIDRLLAALDTPCILVDFHAEATSEKRAMGFYLDGRVSAVLGTHTHVQTADEQILPRGTAYLSDVGMCGPVHSVLGINPEQVIEKFRTGLPQRFENPGGPYQISGAAVDVDPKTGRARHIERIMLCTPKNGA